MKTVFIVLFLLQLAIVNAEEAVVCKTIRAIPKELCNSTWVMDNSVGWKIRISTGWQGDKQGRISIIIPGKENFPVIYRIIEIKECYIGEKRKRRITLIQEGYYWWCLEKFPNTNSSYKVYVFLNETNQLVEVFTIHKVASDK